MKRLEVLIVGAGVAGLCCALRLHRAGETVGLLEASDDIGGRVRTDSVDGFLLDRGFQVLLTAYPEARRVLDLERLELGRFVPGSLVWRAGKLRRLSDPLRRPDHLFATLRAGIGGVWDWVRILQLRRRVLSGSLDELFRRPDRSSSEILRAFGFSEAMIEGFLRPFLSGVFLESELATSSRMLEFVFRMFAQGYAALPAGGMGAIPRQIAGFLPPGSIRVGARVEAVEPREVHLQDGESFGGHAVVVACDGREAARLLPGLESPAFRGTICLYFEASEAAVREPVLVLDGDGTGPVNHVCFPSEVHRSYAPRGRALVSANVVGNSGDDGRKDLVRAVLSQMREWFGPTVETWRHLRSYRIPDALPSQEPGCLEPHERAVRLENGIFVCGDHRDHGSLQGAMVSGRRAADAVLRALS